MTDKTTKYPSRLPQGLQSAIWRIDEVGLLPGPAMTIGAQLLVLSGLVKQAEVLRDEYTQHAVAELARNALGAVFTVLATTDLPIDEEQQRLLAEAFVACADRAAALVHCDWHVETSVQLDLEPEVTAALKKVCEIHGHGSIEEAAVEMLGEALRRPGYVDEDGETRPFLEVS